ncbi:putative RDD family membrane protein YckC [Motilibacter rhizosphaerae]|uniref:Putative RDD family membrane protein YckC n=1 Tax=Motilibacter rhizosphaerae TaxID=598652 RepID=A0A4Q7NGE0_9ACTN|nr:RDD family protein [Motilibacter rhizosphaerae]RZS82879.1 putative RDD family membrane protein YckC [Motilibacter rhizosphaerae]
MSSEYPPPSAPGEGEQPPSAPSYGGPSFEKPSSEPPAAPSYGAPSGPSFEKPAEAPSYGAPAEQPQYGQPQYGQPQYGQPQYGQPQYGQPQYGQPQYGQPAYGYPGAYASWGQRALGTLVDAGLVIGGYIVVFVVAGIIGHVSGVLGGLLFFLGFLAVLALAIWNTVWKQGTTGQSIGKGVAKIKLVREVDGQVLGPGMSFVRQIAHFLDSIPCYVGYLWPLWDPKRQTFADKILQSVVIPV